MTQLCLQSAYNRLRPFPFRMDSVAISAFLCFYLCLNKTCWYRNRVNLEWEKLNKMQFRSLVPSGQVPLPYCVELGIWEPDYFQPQFAKPSSRLKMDLVYSFFAFLDKKHHVLGFSGGMRCIFGFLHEKHCFCVKMEICQLDGWDLFKPFPTTTKGAALHSERC